MSNIRWEKTKQLYQVYIMAAEHEDKKRTVKNGGQSNLQIRSLDPCK